MSENKAAEEKPDPKTCFIVTPVGEKYAETWYHATGIIEKVIFPVVQDEFGYVANAAHLMSTLGTITSQIIKHLLDDDLVVAILTGLNANVMYELAVRHCKAKPIVQMAEDGTSLPFDIHQQRTIFYKYHLGEIDNIKSELRAALADLQENPQGDNPVYQVVRAEAITEVTTAGDVHDYMIQILRRIESAVVSRSEPGGSGPGPLWPSSVIEFMGAKESCYEAAHALKARGSLISGVRPVVKEGAGFALCVFPNLLPSKSQLAAIADSCGVMAKTRPAGLAEMAGLVLWEHLD